VQPTSLTKSVLGITVGTSSAAVRSKVGVPFRRGARPIHGLTCWWYRAEQPSQVQGPNRVGGITGLGFCMNRKHRVGAIVIPQHG
jgi:hypothetical protein